MLTAVTIILASAVLAILAIAMGYVLGWANRAFHVEVDPKVAAIQAVLPGANCGGCGFVGCAEYAEAMAGGNTGVALCAPGGAGCAQQLAEILGVTVAESFPYRAVVHCAARRFGHQDGGVATRSEGERAGSERRGTRPYSTTTAPSRNTALGTSACPPSINSRRVVTMPISTIRPWLPATRIVCPSSYRSRT